MRALLFVALLGGSAIAAPQAGDNEVPAAKKKPVAKKAPKKKKAPPKKKEPEPEIEMEPDPVKAPEPPPPVVIESKPVVEVTVKPKPTASPYKKLYVRAGIAHVTPLSQSRELELADIDGPASLAVQNGPIVGSGSTISSATIPAITVGYRLRERLSIETVVGVPFTVKFKATGTLRDMSIAPTALGIPTGVPALGEELGEAKAAPPMATLVYDLRRGRVRPFVGVGVAILFGFDGKVTNPVLTEVAPVDLKISPAPGVVFQGGLEARLHQRVYARLDLKFIGGMLARARAEHVQVRAPDLPLFDTVEVGTAKMSVWVNPLIVQLGVGTDF